MLQTDSSGITNICIPKKVDGDVNFKFGKFGTISHDESVINGNLYLWNAQVKGKINLKDIKIKGDCDLSGIITDYDFNLSGAEIGGSLILSDATIASIHLGNILVKGDAWFNNIKYVNSDDTVYFYGAHIEGTAKFDGDELHRLRMGRGTYVKKVKVDDGAPASYKKFIKKYNLTDLGYSYIHSSEKGITFVRK